MAAISYPIYGYPIYIILLYLFFGVLPSFVWLLYYLKKDVHPEPKAMILRIFCYGMLIAIPAAFLETGFFKLAEEITLFPLLTSFLKIFIGVAFVEEILKYLVVKIKVLNHHEFDEPIDAMIYMIISALGFAASENILLLTFGLGPKFIFAATLSTTLSRFATATFLHTLCSAIIGYFLAISFLETKKRNLFLSLGLITSVFLHGIYNSYIMNNEGNCNILILFGVLAALAVFVTFGFRKLRKMQSVCKL